MMNERVPAADPVVQGIFRVDAKGRVVFADEQAARILGYVPDELIGRRFIEFHFEADRPLAQGNFARRRLGIGAVTEYSLRHKDGSAVRVAVASAPTLDEGGKFLGVTGFITDIAARRRQEALFSHEIRLLRMIAGNYPHTAVLEDLCLTLEAVSRRPLRAAVMLAEGGGLRCVAAPSLPAEFHCDSAVTALDQGTTACAEAVRSGRAVIVGDTAAGTALDTAPCRKYAIAAVWSYPIERESDILGTLVLLLSVPGEPDAEDRRAVEFAIQVARLALARERDARARYESEQRLRDFAELSADWFWEQDAEYRFIEMSGGAFNKGGFRVADSLGKRRWELPIEGIDAAQWAAHRASLERREVFRDFTYSIRVSDGTLHWYSVSGTPMLGSRGEFLGYRGIGSDITQQVAARDKLEKTRRWLEQAVCAANIGLWERDVESWTFDFGGNWRALFGYTEDEIGHSFEDFDNLVHPDDLARIRTFVRAYEKNPQGDYENRFRIRHKDGSWRWVLSRGRILTDAATKRRTWMGCHIDITEQKLAEDALRASEGLLNEVLELLPVGVWLMDGAGNIVRSNLAGCRIWAGERHVGIEQFGEYKGWWLHSGQRIAPEEWAAARAIMKGETSIDEEIEIECFDGTRKIMLNSAMPIRDSAGAICGGIIVNQDITARWRAESRVRELAATLEARVKSRTAELEEANRELDAFNFSVAHDLRTPLRAIEGFSQALLEDFQDRLDAAGRDYLQRIGAATARMGELIEALYELSRLSRAPLRPRPVDLSAMARELVAELRESEPERSVEIEIEETPPVEGDPHLLRIMLANLLGNAWKFTARAAPARIGFGARTDEHGRVEYCVRDNGAGFDMQFADKLFLMFHRLHREHEFPGRGIGLTTVQRIVARHGGHIRGEGQPGAGASFCFTLWADRDLLADARAAADPGDA